MFFSSGGTFTKNEIKFPVKFGADEKYKVFLVKKVRQQKKSALALAQLSNFEAANEGSTLEFGNQRLTFLGMVKGKEGDVET